MFFQCYALLSSPCSRHFPGTLPSGPGVGFILLGCARVSVHHKTTEELSRLSPEKWVSTRQKQTSFLIFFFNFWSQVCSWNVHKCSVAFPAEGDHTHVDALSPSTNHMVRVPRSRRNSSVLGRVRGDGTARVSPWVTRLHLVLLPHVIIKNALQASICRQ